MIWRIWIAYTVEISKALRLKQTCLGPLLVLAVVLCGPWMHAVSRDGVSDYGFIGYITALSLNFLGFVLLLTYSAGLIAGELSSGSVRAVLVRPLRRSEYVAAKLLLAFTYATVLTLIAAGGAWGVAEVMGELTGVSFGGELLFTAHRMAADYWIGALLGLAPQYAAASFAVMISASTRNVGAAVGGTLGLWIALDMLKIPLHVAPFLFSSYLERPFQVFVSQADGVESAWFPMASHCLAVSGGTVIVCGLAAMLLLHRRNLTA